MRKLLAMVLVLMMLVSVAACTEVDVVISDPNSSVTGESDTPSSSEPSTSKTDADKPSTDATGSQSGDKPSTDAPNTDVTDAPDTDVTDKPNTVTTTTTKKTTTTTTKVATTTKPKDPYLAQEQITVAGDPSDEKGYIYKLGVGGVNVREVTIDSGKGGDIVDIVQITDLHFNTINDKDRQENNPSTMSTYNNRGWLKDGASRPNAEACMKYASFFDQTVVTGDAIDYISWGNLEMLQQVVWDKDPNALVALGNHDAVRVMGLPTDVKDTSTLTERYNLLQSVWKHDIFYTSKVLKNKVMIIQFDNGLGGVRSAVVEKMKADIATAKAKGYTVLVFAHRPFNTNNSAYKTAKAIGGSGTLDLYTGGFGGTKAASTSGARQVWDLVTNNADVVKGVFTGHEHAHFYTEIKAKTSAGKSAVVPQYLLSSAAYDKGNVLKITVK